MPRATKPYVQQLLNPHTLEPLLCSDRVHHNEHHSKQTEIDHITFKLLEENKWQENCLMVMSPTEVSLL